jgi:hypothetical protein
MVEIAVPPWKAPPAEHFVQHQAVRKNIGPLVHRFPLGLFRRHIRGRPHDCPGLCCGHGVLFFGRRLLHFGQPKVQQLDPIDADQNVSRFQIAMHDSLVVRGLQSIRDLQRDPQSLFRR